MFQKREREREDGYGEQREDDSKIENGGYCKKVLRSPHASKVKANGWGKEKYGILRKDNNKQESYFVVS